MQNSAHEQVSSLLARLDKSLNKNRGKNKKDWKAINEARQRVMFKPKEGKNQLLFLTPSFGQDPFTEWGFHNNLQETSYYSVQCDAFNNNGKCVVCDTVESLKSEDFTGNKSLWAPIEQKIEYYAPLINLETAATIAEGPKWMRISKTIMNQFVEWLKNMEEGEFPFYDAINPSRVLLTYNKNEMPMSQYKLEQKPLTQKFTAEQIAEWSESILPIAEYIVPKSQEEITKIVEDYFKRVYETVENSLENGEADEAEEVVETPPTALVLPNTAGKLSKLKLK